MFAALTEELDQLPAELRALLAKHNFNQERFLSLAQRVGSSEAEQNQLTGKLTPPKAEELIRLPDPDSDEGRRLIALGSEALSQGRCALVVLAGGMATRMGGVVKSLVEVFPGQTFLDLRLREMDAIAQRYGQRAPFWLMTSDATDEAIGQALGDGLDGETVATFVQELSLRLTPEGRLFRDEKGKPSVHAQGHGDLPDALRSSGLLARFIQRGGRYLTLSNIDNLGATLDPLLIGVHIDRGRPLTCELVENLGSDKGGVPVSVDGASPIIVEDFRLPQDFDRSSVPVFNSNTFHADAQALEELNLAWTFFLVKKRVGDATAIQFERLIQELTAHMPTTYVQVPRTGAKSRFLPVKDFSELEQRRATIRAVVQDRGIVT